MQNTGVLFPRDVNDGVVRADSVERCIGKGQGDQVRTDPKPRGHMAFGKVELRVGKVDADDRGMSRKPLSDWDPSPATGVKNARPGGEAADRSEERRVGKGGRAR